MTATTVYNNDTSGGVSFWDDTASKLIVIAASIWLLGWGLSTVLADGYSFDGAWLAIHVVFWAVVIGAFLATGMDDVNATPFALGAAIMALVIALVATLLPLDMAALAGNGDQEAMDALAAAELDGSCADVSDSVNFFDAPDKRSPLATGPALPEEVAELKPRVEGRVAQSAFQAVYYAVGLDPENIMGLKADGAGSSDWIELLRGNAERHLDICQDVVRAIQLADNAALVPDWRPEDGEAAYLVSPDRETIGWLELPVPEEGVTALLWYPAYNEQEPDSIRPIVFLPEWGVFAADDPIGDIPTIQGGVDDFYGGNEQDEAGGAVLSTTTTAIVTTLPDGSTTVDVIETTTTTTTSTTTSTAAGGDEEDTTTTTEEPAGEDTTSTTEGPAGGDTTSTTEGDGGGTTPTTTPDGGSGTSTTISHGTTTVPPGTTSTIPGGSTTTTEGVPSTTAPPTTTPPGEVEVKATAACDLGVEVTADGAGTFIVTIITGNGEVETVVLTFDSAGTQVVDVADDTNFSFVVTTHDGKVISQGDVNGCKPGGGTTTTTVQDTTTTTVKDTTTTTKPSTTTTKPSTTTSTTQPTTTTSTTMPSTTTTKPTTTTTVPAPNWSAQLKCDISGELAKWVLDISSSGTPATFSPSDGTSWLVRDVGNNFSVTVTALWSGGSESRIISSSGDCGKDADENPPPPPPP